MTTRVQFADYISTTLAAGTDASQVTMSVVSAAGFPSTANGYFFYMTIVDLVSWAADTQPPIQREIVRVTGVSGTTITVDRGITTTAQVWAAGSVIELRSCRQALYDLKIPAGGTTGQVLSKTNSNDFDTEWANPSGSGAPIDATYVVMSANATLTNERVLTAGSGITIVDGGANGPVTINATNVSTSVVFITNNIFNVPATVSGILVYAVGGGGGGWGTISGSTASGGGGGAAEEGAGVPMSVTPGGTVTVTIGAGGLGGVGNGLGTDGGTTTVGQYSFLGGRFPIINQSGGGGGPGGRATTGTPNTAGGLGLAENTTYFGGSSGASPATGGANGQPGGGSGGYLVGGAGGAAAGGRAGGGGGAATVYGPGGAGGVGDGNGVNAPTTSYGAGGGGSGGSVSGNKTGGSGCHGFAMITYIL